MPPRFSVTAITPPTNQATSRWAKLTESERLGLVSRLEQLHGDAVADRRVMAQRMGALPKAIEKSLWEAVSLRDPGAEAETDSKAHLEPDPELRDNENVPLPDPVA